MNLAGITSTKNEAKPQLELVASEDVVEIGILLPANRAADLIRVAKSRQESVGHMVRRLIENELAAARRSG